MLDERQPSAEALWKFGQGKECGRIELKSKSREAASVAKMSAGETLKEASGWEREIPPRRGKGGMPRDSKVESPTAEGEGEGELCTGYNRGHNWAESSE